MKRKGELLALAAVALLAAAGGGVAENMKGSTKTPAGATPSQLRAPDVLAPTERPEQLETLGVCREAGDRLSSGACRRLQEKSPSSPAPPEGSGAPSP